MPRTANSMDDLKDEAYVKTVIEGLGGVRELVAGMREYHEVVAQMRSERSDLTDRYPGRWVAMGRDGVLAVGDSMDDVLAEVESQGLSGGDVVIEFLDTTPPLLIL